MIKNRKKKIKKNVYADFTDLEIHFINEIYKILKAKVDLQSKKTEENQQILTLKQLKPFDLKSVIRIVCD